MNTLNHFTTDLRTQNSKPTGPEVGVISQQLNNVIETEDPKNLLEAVTQPNGYSWSPGVFDGTRNNDNWLGSDIIALDFDDGVPLQDTLDSIEDPFKPQIYYHTFSHSKDTPKYRLVWLLDEFIDDPTTYKVILKGLIDDLGADKACKDPSRFFFGGSTGALLSSKRTSAQHLFNYAETAIVSNTSQERLYKIERDNAYNNDTKYADDGSELADKLNKVSERQPNDSHWEKMMELDIMKQFTEGRKDFRHPDVFLLATHMHWIKGGISFMAKVMNKTNKEGKTDYNRNNFNALRTARKHRYFPQSLKESRFDDDCYAIPFYIFGVRGEIKEHEDADVAPELTIKEAEDRLQNVINYDYNGTSIIKTPPGLGKTEVFLESLKDEKKVVAAFPTHALKDEAAERLDDKGVDYRCTPEIPKFENDKITNRMDRFFAAGMISEAMSTIYDAADGKFGVGIDMIRAEAYTQELKAAHSFNGPILTTHQKAIYSDFNHDKMVFDEDPSDIILEWQSISLHDLLNLRKKKEIIKIADMELEFGDEELENAIRDLLIQITDLEKGKIVPTPDWSVTIEDFVDAIIEKGIHADIASFLTSDLVKVEEDDPNVVQFIKRSDIPQDKTVLVMSASINTDLYCEMYDDVRVEDLGAVEHKGEVVCHTKKSYSKTSLRCSDKEEIKNLTDKPTITFSDAKNLVSNPVEDLHFFNTSGYDYLKGHDIAVVGTPHKPLEQYEMIAEIVGIEVSDEGRKKAYRTVVYEGLEFKFFTFADEKLQRLHLNDISGELSQAVGRARALRCDCKVDVFTNFPVREATKYTWK